MKFTNKFNLPEAVFEAVTSSDYDPGESTFSATGLLKPPQMAVLTRRYHDQIEEEAMGRVWSLLGQAAHHILERHGSDDSLVEERLYVEMLGEKIGGQVDHYNRGIITDYKVTSAYSIVYGSKEKEWEEQLNIYAYLFAHNGYAVKKLQIVTILRDWSAAKALQDPSYPQSPIVVVPIKLWGLEEQRGFIYQRLGKHIGMRDVADEELTPCTPEEMWEKPTTYAVFKGSNKKASRVLHSIEDTEQWIKDNLSDKDKPKIEIRPGERTRCEKYCPVKDFCHQYKEYKANADNRNED